MTHNIEDDGTMSVSSHDAKIATLERNLVAARERIAKWEAWQPNDVDLSNAKQQYGDGSSKAAATVYISVLEAKYRKATAWIAVLTEAVDFALEWFKEMANEGTLAATVTLRRKLAAALTAPESGVAEKESSC